MSRGELSTQLRMVTSISFLLTVSIPNSRNKECTCPAVLQDRSRAISEFYLGRRLFSTVALNPLIVGLIGGRLFTRRIRFTSCSGTTISVDLTVAFSCTVPGVQCEKHRDALTTQFRVHLARLEGTTR